MKVTVITKKRERERERERERVREVNIPCILFASSQHSSTSPQGKPRDGSKKKRKKRKERKEKKEKKLHSNKIANTREWN